MLIQCYTRARQGTIPRFYMAADCSGRASGKAEHWGVLLQTFTRCPLQETYGIDLPKGTPLAVAACSDRHLHVFDIRCSGKAEFRLEASQRGAVRCLASCGHTLASGCADGSVRIFDTRMWKQMGAIRPHMEAVNCIAINTALRLVVSGGDDGRVRPSNSSRTCHSHTHSSWRKRMDMCTISRLAPGMRRIARLDLFFGMCHLTGPGQCRSARYV